MGRGWTILEAGNRGNVLMRSVGAQVYGDLSDWAVLSGNCAGEEYERDEASAGKSGAAIIRSAMRIGVHVAHLSRRDNGRSRRGPLDRWPMEEFALEGFVSCRAWRSADVLGPCEGLDDEHWSTTVSAYEGGPRGTGAGTDVDWLGGK
jgi:hypothetical protein